MGEDDPVPLTPDGFRNLLQKMEQKDVSGMTEAQAMDHLESINAVKALLAKEENFRQMIAERNRKKTEPVM